MLATLGYDSLDDLIAAALPSGLPRASLAAGGLAAGGLAAGGLAVLPPARTEQQALAELRRLAARNTVRTSMIGLGYYGTNTPAVIRRNVLENPAWYTAYTPYQPEISQGRLEALLNFQTMVCDLTALPVANASLLDEASAAAEAMTLCRRVTKGDVFLADADCLPQTLDVLRTRAEPLGIELRVAPVSAETDFAGVFGVLLQYPGASGEVRDLAPVVEAAHAAKATVAVAADILALTLLKPPGEFGADIALGSTQRFGVPMAYGGPHAAYLAVREDLKRQLPGRLVGVSVDADGRPALRLALQAREQHIRREKATSNICTAQVLLAVAASMYAVLPRPRRPDGHRAARAPQRDDARRHVEELWPDNEPAASRSTPSASSSPGRPRPGPRCCAPRTPATTCARRAAASSRSPATRRPRPTTSGTWWRPWSARRASAAGSTRPTCG